MKTLKQCNGTTLRYKPKYQTTYECGECGALHKIKPYEIEAPSFHVGPFDYIIPESRIRCITCGETWLDPNYIAKKELERISESIPALFERDDIFFKSIK